MNLDYGVVSPEHFNKMNLGGFATNLSINITYLLQINGIA